MFVWGLPVNRLVHTFSNQWGSYDVDTITNLVAENATLRADLDAQNQFLDTIKSWRDKADVKLRAQADIIATISAERAKAVEGFNAINSLGGNVDHDKPGGHNDAAMRG